MYKNLNYKEKKISWNIDDIDNIKDRIETSVFPQGILLTIFLTLEKRRNIHRNIDLFKRLMNGYGFDCVKTTSA